MREPDPRPNIIYFLADDLGWSDVGFHGSEIQTPNLDRLARGGARLDAFYVLPVCSPTRAALMTGRYPMRYGLHGGVIRPWSQYGLPLDERTLPQALSEAGYTTAICGKWHLGHFQQEYLPTRRGFKHQYGHYNGMLDYFTHERDGGFDWHRDDRVNRDEGYATVLVGDEAVRLIEHEIKPPFFIYMPFNAPHIPLQALPEHLKLYEQIENADRRTFAAMVHALDEQVGRVVAALEKRNLARETLFLFSSDNGGPTFSGATNGRLYGGKGTLYEGGVRVPAFATWDGHIPLNSVVDAPLHIVDWYPTLLNLAGASLDQPLSLDGGDIWPTISQRMPSPHDCILLNTTPRDGAIRMGDWKLVLNGRVFKQPNAATNTAQVVQQPSKKPARAKPAIRPNRVQLFNLTDDPLEQHNLAKKNVQKVRELQDRLDSFAKQAVPPMFSPRDPNFKTPKVWGEF